MRSWKENLGVVALAEAHGLPCVSGGDRHAKEPNANLNLTNARTFAGFVEEVRSGYSTVLFMPQYREAAPLRILSTVCQVMADNPQHANGWTHWSQRGFYRFPNGEVRSLAEMWSHRRPDAFGILASLLRVLDSRGMRSALRFAVLRDPEIA